jgi:hypothetical protein
MRKNILIILIGSLMLWIAIFSYLNFKEQNFLKFNNKIEIIKLDKQNQLNPQIDDKDLYEKYINASLIVLNNKYDIEIKEGSSVFDFMEKIKKENNNFDFKYKEYPSLGIFVNGINGVDGGGGKYWIYFVNKKEASVGVSNYILREGDIINWELK